MRRTVRDTKTLGDLSPVTANGSIVYSTLRVISDLDDPTKTYYEEYTADATDAIKVLQFLDNLNGIGWTDELKRIERELRAALHDLMSVKPTQEGE